MVRDEGPLQLTNSRKQIKNVISTPKYERRHAHPRGKSADRSTRKCIQNIQLRTQLWAHLNLQTGKVLKILLLNEA